MAYSTFQRRQTQSSIVDRIQSGEITRKKAMRRAALQIAAYAKGKLNIEDEIQIIEDDLEV